ncbi:hypothetical protein MmiAt1_03260 [Methanimicrococcus sp. At1]|uniref:Uncharacterized protein n=1 Tax=Methanimicrococcus hacksteinii TaxID=3028293 RepID=A0ABU3VNK1_9EURY|nr:hypothetical protein [Methanimicrococcus sp. At1]MDV0444786.1 hypothetical protein [Methanimicrococcus sp. At1]
MSGQFYFVSNQYFEDFSDPYLMKNKESLSGTFHDRPCFFAFPDSKCSKLLWLVPVSSKVEKYKSEYQKKCDKYGYCNTIYFCDFLGQERAFLIQNMFPVVESYLSDIYIDVFTQKSVQLRSKDQKKLIRHAKNVLKAHRQKKKIIFVNVDLIQKQL